LYQQPIKLGIDLVVHTASKYLGGHSDVVAGVCCGSSKLIGKIFANEFLTLGGILSPFNAWLVLRGLRTLPIRMEHVSRATLQIISFLKTQPKVKRIYYPMLLENDQFDMAQSQMKQGSGLFTVAFDSTPEAIESFCNNLTYWRMAVSWGGFESLVIPSCTFVQPGLYSILPPTLVRFSVGLEDADTLISDIDKNINYL
jgi:cystathionine beta-lyase/cystathionine gamma-synthase